MKRLLETKRTPRYSLRKLNERSSKSLNYQAIIKVAKLSSDHQSR